MLCRFKKYLSIFKMFCCVVAILFVQREALGQDETGSIFKIDNIACNKEEQDVKIYVKAVDAEGRSSLKVADASRFEVFEKVGNDLHELDIEGLKIKNTPEDFAEDGEEVYFEPLYVLFLMDLSGSMKGENLMQAKSAILNVLESGVLTNSDVSFAWFDEEVSRSIPISLENFNTIMDPMNPRGKDTNLYGALQKKINELASLNGRKSLILLTDGKHDGNEGTPINDMDIINDVAGLDSSFYIFPIGIGKNANENFLKSIAQTSPNIYDKYEFGVAPQDIRDVFEKILLGIRSNIVLSVKPHKDFCNYGVEERTFAVRYLQNSGKPKVASKKAILGSNASDCSLCREDAMSWWIVFLIGVIFLALIYFITFPILYFWKRHAFRKKYIRSYWQVRKPKVRKVDPMLLTAFEDHDKVVVVGEEMMLLSTWEYYSDKKDQITKDHQHFFDIEVLNKKSLQQRIQWLLFGSVGGFIAWLLHNLLGELDLKWYQDALDSLNTNQKQISLSVYMQTLIGLSLGTSICAALAVVEELGQSRKFSIGRVLGRMFIGGLIAFCIFFVESVFIANILPIKYLGGLVGWTLFGTALGGIVSIWSSIEGKKGLLGGLVAGIIAFHIYFLLNLFESETAQVIGFIIYGGLLGFILYFIVTYLEDFEIVYLSPKRFEGDRKPISKWLKSNQIEYIYIGTDGGCEVFVKWDDPTVIGRHAKLMCEKGQVFIEPIAITFINGREIREKTMLKNEDIIQVGTSEISKMQFLEKEKTSKKELHKGTEFEKGGNNAGGMYQKPQQRRRITVKRRNRRQ